MIPTGPLVGKTEPRLFTPPLVELTPDTSLGFEAVRFAETVLGIDLIPWQSWYLVHALELSGDQLRYRTVVTLLPRQNGKTELLSIISAYFLFSNRAKLILGTAQALDIAREAWQKTVDHSMSSDHTRPEVADIRRTNGEQCLTLTNGARYRIAASTRGAGRGLSVDLLILDELREHRSWESWSALAATTTARPGHIKFGVSNAGDSTSVVLNTLRSSALSGDEPSVGLFEWSAPDGCALDDEEAWCQANPSLGYTITAEVLRSALATATPAVFRTEHLCQTVESLDNAIDQLAWQSSIDTGYDLRDSKITAGIDVSIDGTHVTLVGAALDSGRYRLEVLGAWRTTEEARTELPALLDKIRPASLVWVPGGPAAVLGPELRGYNAVETKASEVSEACQSFADLVTAGRIIHPGDPLLSSQVANASRFNVGDGWRFARKGGVGYVDSVYAAAIAVYSLRSHTKTVPRPMVV